jgi:radical SAM superfamily enzyme YgiQ (UPF0313 family)
MVHFVIDCQIMKVLLISANTETINMPTLPIGLGCVAAAVQGAGHEVTLLDLMTREDVAGAIASAVEETAPEVIGISIRNIDDQCMDAPRFLLGQAKEAVSVCRGISDAPVVLGGAGYSIFPESALGYLDADMGIQGEGEDAFVALLERIRQKAALSDVPGLYLKGRGAQRERRFSRDLDALPMLPPSLLPLPDAARKGEYWLPFQTRRGCPLRCSYCSTPAIEGHRIRRRSPQRVVSELRQWRGAGFSRVYFVDNTFNMPPSYAEDLCHRLADADLGISWRAIIYPKNLSSSLVKAMKQAGCTDVSLGFESGSTKILRSMNKRFGIEDVRTATHLLKEHGIGQMGFLLLGGPGETRATVEESLSFIDSLPLNAVKLTLGIRIYPNTPLAKRAVEEGRVAAGNDLLFPEFYMVEGLYPWLQETIHALISERPNWTY